MNKRPVVLTFVRYYLPGYKSGGPVRSIANMVEHLGDEVDFRIITSDRDALDTAPYPKIKVDDWNTIGKAQVFYVSPGRRTLGGFVESIRSTPYDVLYLNSFFDSHFTGIPLLGRWLNRLPSRPVVIAPRGEFSPGALEIRAWKKWPYILLSRLLRLYRHLTWQASSEHEAAEIRKIIGKVAHHIVIAPNLPSPVHMDGSEKDYGERHKGTPLQVVFLSRISLKKNLDFALRVLGKVKVPVQFNIYGPIGDPKHWEYCKNLMSNMPQNVSVRYAGTIEHSNVMSVLSANDLLFLPTRGENYGHVIIEAMAAGTPVLVADTTPWRDLEKAGVGWDLPLDDEDRFVTSIHSAAGFSNEKYRDWRKQVRKFARTHTDNTGNIETNRQMFLGCQQFTGTN